MSLNWWWGRNDDLGLRASDRDWDVIDALYATYAEKAITYPYGQVVFDLSDVQPYIDNLSNVYNTYMPQIVFGMEQSEPEAFVEEFRNALKAAGYETVMAEIQRQLGRRVRQISQFVPSGREGVFDAFPTPQLLCRFQAAGTSPCGPIYSPGGIAP